MVTAHIRVHTVHAHVYAPTQSPVHMYITVIVNMTCTSAGMSTFETYLTCSGDKPKVVRTCTHNKSSKTIVACHCPDLSSNTISMLRTASPTALTTTQKRGVESRSAAAPARFYVRARVVHARVHEGGTHDMQVTLRVSWKVEAHRPPKPTHTCQLES